MDMVSPFLVEVFGGASWYNTNWRTCEISHRLLQCRTKSLIVQHILNRKNCASYLPRSVAHSHFYLLFVTGSLDFSECQIKIYCSKYLCRRSCAESIQIWMNACHSWFLPYDSFLGVLQTAAGATTKETPKAFVSPDGCSYCMDSWILVDGDKAGPSHGISPWGRPMGTPHMSEIYKNREKERFYCWMVLDNGFNCCCCME